MKRFNLDLEKFIGTTGTKSFIKSFISARRGVSSFFGLTFRIITWLLPAGELFLTVSLKMCSASFLPAYSIPPASVPQTLLENSALCLQTHQKVSLKGFCSWFARFPRNSLWKRLLGWILVEARYSFIPRLNADTRRLFVLPCFLYQRHRMYQSSTLTAINNNTSIGIA